MFTSKEIFWENPCSEWGMLPYCPVCTNRCKLHGIGCMENGSYLNAAIQSDIADQYGVLTGKFHNQAGRWRMAFGGSGGCRTRGFNGFWGGSSERNGTFYNPLLRKSSNRQRKDILLLKGSLGNCCTSHPCPPDLLGNSLWFCGESFRLP